MDVATDSRPVGFATVARPTLARWIWERGLELRQVAAGLGCSYEQVRLICLPFGDPKRRVPTTELIERIVAYTAGEITAADFYPPHLVGAAVQREAPP